MGHGVLFSALDLRPRKKVHKLGTWVVEGLLCDLPLDGM